MEDIIYTVRYKSNARNNKIPWVEEEGGREVERERVCGGVKYMMCGWMLMSSSRRIMESKVFEVIAIRDNWRKEGCFKQSRRWN